MTERCDAIMKALYGHNIWEGFTASPVEAAVQGWNGDHPSLTKLASAPGDKVVVDVGVWKGQSTITMASALRARGINGCVIGVDTFLGSREHWNLGPSFFTRRAGMPDIYQTFLSNVHAMGLQGYVVPLPQTSLTAAWVLQKVGITAAIVHIDAAHEYDEVLRDASEYWKVLAPGGLLIGDDYHTTWPGVVRAAGEFSAKTNVPLSIEFPKWIMRKPAA